MAVVAFATAEHISTISICFLLFLSNLCMNDWLNKAIVGDNLEVMKQLPSNSIDLIYCDILYGTGRDFGDYKDLKANRKEIKNFYIPRIKEMYRLLKKTGAIYLQMDTRINHWIRCILDDVFGYSNFKNELIWCYNSQGKTTKLWNKKHDHILYYTKSDKWTFNHKQVKDSISDLTYKRFKKEIEKKGYYTTFKNGKEYKYHVKDGSLPKDWFEDVRYISRSSKERTNYATQKPKALLQRIIKASSNKGDIVADFFCGSGTTLEAANELERNFFGCDINPKAIEITNSRIKSSLFSTV